MELKVYEGTYPEHLKLKKELNQGGLKAMVETAIFKNDKGYSYKLYSIDSAIPLTLEDSNTDLLLWREGLKSKEQLNVEELYLLRQIESQVKTRIIKEYPEKEGVSFETIYFDNEYPKDKLGKKTELNRKGLRGIDKVAVYLSKDTCYHLYSIDSAIPLEIDSSTKTEKNYWLDGLKSGIINLDEATKLNLISKIEHSLDSKISNKKKEAANSKKTQKNSKKEKSKPALDIVRIKELISLMLEEKVYSNQFRELNHQLAKIVYRHYLSCYGESFVNCDKIEESLFIFIAENKLKGKAFDYLDVYCDGNWYEPIYLDGSDVGDKEFVTVYYDNVIRVVPFSDEEEWEMRDGNLIPIKYMQTSHIRNTLRMLEKNVAYYKKTIEESNGTFKINYFHSCCWIEKFKHELSKRNA